MNEWPETSVSLILRVKDPEDAVAWSQFLTIYRPVVYRLARRDGLQHADAEDLAQQVFLSIAHSVERWEPGQGLPRFRAWLYRIARNAIVNAITRRRKDSASGSTSVRELLASVPYDNDFETALQNESRLQAFRWAAKEVAQEFGATTWAMFWETAVEGRSVSMVAADHERSTGSVYVARYRVMQRIKEKLCELSDILE